MGNHPQLGRWSPDEMLFLDGSEYPYWKGEIFLEESACDLEYKYAVYKIERCSRCSDEYLIKTVDLEKDGNRHFHSPHGSEASVSCLIQDYPFRSSRTPWKAAGLVLPVFSLRSRRSFGIGEFRDLAAAARWASQCGMKILQTLPVNDTTLYHNRRDSYPYNALSVFALNPIFLNVEDMGSLSPALLKRYRAEQNRLNALDIADYEQVAALKVRYFNYLYKRDHEALFSSGDYQTYFVKNAFWLKPYAVFCYLRDRYGSPDFRHWPLHSTYDAGLVERMCRPDYKDYSKIALYFYLQFHADRQLRAAHQEALKAGVVLKGDIPIGISPDSVDAWVYPELFHGDVCAGAPPDDFSIAGQNWGFPTYHWLRMEKDGFSWWKQRLSYMAGYFDAYRIDHILGFFRIWEIPQSQVWGLEGRFSPALPYSEEELRQLNVEGSIGFLTQPFITHEMLEELFGSRTEEVIGRCFELSSMERENRLATYRFRPEYDTQRKIKAAFSDCPELRDKLYLLHSEVLLLEDLRIPKLYHPRIALQKSLRFRYLSAEQQRIFSQLHDDFYYHRHSAFWSASAMSKLPELVHATSMLSCGEDLGMVPSCVPEVMKSLDILSLEIERMPKSWTEFGDTEHLPYMSVCATGTHDMNPLRAWWKEDREKSQRYYHDILHHEGQAPEECGPALVEEIIRRHLQSPSMWAILPWQDWMALDARLRRRDEDAERINVPVDSHNYWCYRMHLCLEDLLEEQEFSQRLHRMIEESGR